MITADQALARLQRLCSRSEKCTADVRKKLAEWNIPPKETVFILRQLQQQGFIDDVRYTKAFVRDKQRLAHWGNLKIIKALQIKKISRDTIAIALQEINPVAYKEELIVLLRRKEETLKIATLAERKQKLMRFALSRGYEYTLVYEVVMQL